MDLAQTVWNLQMSQKSSINFWMKELWTGEPCTYEYVTFLLWFCCRSTLHIHWYIAQTCVCMYVCIYIYIYIFMCIYIQVCMLKQICMLLTICQWSHLKLYILYPSAWVIYVYLYKIILYIICIYEQKLLETFYVVPNSFAIPLDSNSI